MNGELLQIYWHNKLPIFAVDFDPNHLSTRFVTGGADNNARIWEIDAGSNEVQFVSTLSKHIRAVNCARWSPLGTVENGHSLLATAGDGGSLFVWHFVSHSTIPNSTADTTYPLDDSNASQSTCDLQLDAAGQEEQEISKETWKVRLNLETGNPFDIYALEWSPCSKFIATGTSDDCVRIYSLREGQCVRVIRDHAHFVNGICWDPLKQYLISMSSDRSIKVSRILASNANYVFRTQALCKISKGMCVGKQSQQTVNDECCTNSTVVHKQMKGENNYSNVNSSIELEDAKCKLQTNSNGTQSSQKETTISHDGFRLFADESLISFFRKGTFSPDGAYFYAPAGLTETGSHCVHVFIRNGFHLAHPIYSIGGFDKSPVGIFFSPQRMIRINGRVKCWIFAVLTTDKVFIFESENYEGPLFVVQNYHLSTLTDACWQPDGKRLLVSSTDGFMSMFAFDWGSGYEPDAQSRENSLTKVEKLSCPSEELNCPMEELNCPMEELNCPMEICPEPTNVKTVQVERSVDAANAKKRIAPTLIASS